MNAPLSPAQRRAILQLVEDARAIAEAVPPPPKRERRAPQIRALALEGLDDQAIAAATGASRGAVATTVARLRRDGVEIPRGRRAGRAILLELEPALRAALVAEAARRGIGPTALARELIARGLPRPSGADRVA